MKGLVCIIPAFALALLSASAMPLGVRTIVHGRAAVNLTAAGTESATVIVDVDDGKAAVEEREGGGYVVTAKDGETISESDIAISSEIDGTPIVVTAGYDIAVASDGKSATVTLKMPTIGAAAIAAAELAGEVMVADKDESDESGALVDVDAVVAHLGAAAIKAVPATGSGEELGAMPVKSVRGLWYQASWGDSLENMTDGGKVQATGTVLYLGVIKQSGTKGFYKLRVSER